MRKKENKKYFLAIGLLVGALVLTGCQGGIQGEASYPTRQSGSDQIVYSDQKRDTIWGEGSTFADFLSGRDRHGQAGSGIGVNSFLWRASLDTISFMPVKSADPFGGVILTDWYENPEAPGERFKVNLYILDRQLRADGVRASVFKQTLDRSGNWRDTTTPDRMADDIETVILTRARQLRVASDSVRGR